MAEKFCRECGTALPEQSNFCLNCGSAVARELASDTSPGLSQGAVPPVPDAAPQQESVPTPSAPRPGGWWSRRTGLQKIGVVGGAVVVLALVAAVVGTQANGDGDGSAASTTASTRASAVVATVPTEAPTSTTSAPTTSAPSTSTSVPRPTTTTEPELFTRENWALLDTDPESHKGARVDIVGQVFVAPERDSVGTYWQMWADPRNSEWNTVVAYSDPKFQVRDEDYVHVIGTITGAFEGENAFGGVVTATAILATSAEVVDATALASPAVRTAEVNLSQKQHGLTVTLTKVEFAADETRVYVTVENASSYEASFYGFNAKAVQGNTQYDPDLWGTDYPEVQSEILPGVKTSGVVVFGAMDPSKSTKVYLEGRTDNWRLDFRPYVFTIPAG